MMLWLNIFWGDNQLIIKGQQKQIKPISVITTKFYLTLPGKLPQMAMSSTRRFFISKVEKYQSSNIKIYWSGIQKFIGDYQQSDAFPGVN